jgi:3-(methylthio)propanoyl-CoA dehydrogenase
MSEYRAPVKDMRFVMDELAGFKELSSFPGFEEATADVADAILEESARFSGEVLAPLNRTGDKEGCKLTASGVTTPTGWKEAYAQYRDAGWNGMTSPPEFGGQGLPDTLGIAVKEMLCSANMAFSLGPLLTTGAVEALLTCASDELKAIYLEKMISGEWTGTMNLTEPQAGSDLALIRSRAEPQADGSYKVFGQKIFITYGDHDMTENIVHLVLARLPDAPAGVKGISMFLVPKFMVNGRRLARRPQRRLLRLHRTQARHPRQPDLRHGLRRQRRRGRLPARRTESRPRIHVHHDERSPPRRRPAGHRARRARLPAGAGGYARERKQGRDAVTGEALVSIDKHPDIRRMLMLMKSRVEACRAMTYLHLRPARPCACGWPIPPRRRRCTWPNS